MANIIATVVILAIVGIAVGYIIRAKKRGQKCIGCPESCHCGKDGNSCGGCRGFGNG